MIKKAIVFIFAVRKSLKIAILFTGLRKLKTSFSIGEKSEPHGVGRKIIMIITKIIMETFISLGAQAETKVDIAIIEI